MATLRVTSLRGRTAGASPELPDGAVVTGVTTTGSAIVGAAVTINASGVDAGAGIVTATQFSGNATGLTGTPDITIRNVTGVAATFTGVLTYDDVTNVDSLGIVTARGGFEIGASGVGGTITAAGAAEFAGIVTASEFHGDASNLTNLPASGDSNDITASLFI